MPDFKHLNIVSGGQTGADRAALDFALENGIKCGGWCPKGRKAEDGRIPERYPLKEASAADYQQRTELNVQDSDGTVIFTITKSLSGGSKKTATFALKHKKPILHISRATPSPAQELRRFLQEHKVRVLNLAGTRASKEPEVAEFVLEVLSEVFGK
jgi:hypothetical protein